MYQALQYKFIDPKEIIKLFNLKEGYKFADFGSGSGAYVLLASKIVGDGGIVYAIDIQKDLLLNPKNLTII